jgi:hypothetical protein
MQMTTAERFMSSPPACRRWFCDGTFFAYIVTKEYDMKETRRVNNAQTNGTAIGLALAAALFLGSCSIGLAPDTSGPEDDLAQLDQALNITANSAVAAAEAQLDDSDGIGASTTYNNPGMDPVLVVDADAEQVNLPARTDYPYPGWTTTGTVEHIPDPAAYGTSEGWDNTVGVNSEGDSNRLFKVTAIASPDVAGVYPEDEVREVYYVESNDDSYSDADWIFEPYNWAGNGYRDSYVAEYADGSTRDHWIIANGATYEAFDINGSLDFDSVLAGGPSSGSAEYSSATMYTHELGRTFNYWFWNNNDDVTPYIVGVRYYTEHLEGDEYVGTSLTFEYTYDNAWRIGDTTPILLARTVIREEMRFAHDDQNGNGTFDAGEVGAATDHTLRLRTEVNNSSGGDGLVYTRQGKSLTDWNSRGNARSAQLAGVQRDTLPSGYGNIADFEAVLDDLDGGSN